MPENNNNSFLNYVPLVGTAINAISQIGQNRKNRRLTRDLNNQNIQFAQNSYNQQIADRDRQYGIERANSLADWNMQNSYNSPSAQMQRLRDANLNPNLVYGNGAEAQSQSMPRSTNGEVPTKQNPQLNAPPPGQPIHTEFSSFFDARMKEAQINNLETQNDVLIQEALLKTRDSDLRLVDTQTKQFDLDFKKNNLQYSSDAVRMNTEKLSKDLQQMDLNMTKTREETTKIRADTDYTTDSNTRAALQNSTSIKEAMQRILTSQLENTMIPARKAELQAKIKNLNASTTLAEFDAQLRKNNIMPGDNAVTRTVTNLLNQLGDKDGLMKIENRLRSSIKNFFNNFNPNKKR
jgi:hypothetical protein